MTRVMVAEDASALALAVGEALRDAALAVDRRFTIALSGGSTPRRLYEMLAAPPLRDEIPWDRLEVFFGDERAVSPDDADSNYGMAVRALLARVDVLAWRMRAEIGAADEYETIVRDRVPPGPGGSVPEFDLVLLGIGGDGHTASLFPGTAALGEAKHLVVMNEVPKLGAKRMTFTYPLLNAARRVWILAAGADKREIVAACRAAGDDEETRRRWPITGVRPAGELVWWLDRAAMGEGSQEGART